MQVGSLVECIVDWTECRIQWGYKYPNKGDILTISEIIPINKPGATFNVSFAEGYFGPDGSVHESTVREVQPPMSLDFVEEMQKEKTVMDKWIDVLTESY